MVSSGMPPRSRWCASTAAAFVRSGPTLVMIACSRQPSRSSIASWSPAALGCRRTISRTGTDAEVDSLPAWLTTVTTRLCLDRLRSRTPVPVGDVGPEEILNDPADDVALADTVGLALSVVLDRLSPRERVAFVLHDSFGFEFPTIAALLDTTPAAARKLASRARAKVTQPHSEDRLADWEVVDAFMAAAKNGDFDRLMRLLAPDTAVTADDAAVLVGTPRQIEGRYEVATFFNGSAQMSGRSLIGMTVCLEGLRPLTSCSEPAVRRSEIRWSRSAPDRAAFEPAHRCRA
jgi:Sigma-70, region 4